MWQGSALPSSTAPGTDQPPACSFSGEKSRTAGETPFGARPPFSHPSWTAMKGSQLEPGRACIPQGELALQITVSLPASAYYSLLS